MALTQLPNAFIKRTFARPTCNLSAARDTLVAVRFAVRAAHRFTVLRTITRTYAINQIHGFNAVFVARRVRRSFRSTWNRVLTYSKLSYLRGNYLVCSHQTHTIKRTFGALAVRPTFNLSAARGTLVAVRFAVRAAHRFIVLRTNARTYAINKIHGCNADSWNGGFK